MGKRLLALFLAATMIISLLPTVALATETTYAITNGTPESAKETNHGYITVNETAAEGETVTITVNPAEGYQLKSLTVTPVAPTEYTVTFDLNGITGTAPEAQTIKYGGKVNKPADPTADGYTFGGWYKEATCTNAWDFANDTVTANTTLYAKWKPEDEGSYILKAQGNWFKAFSETTTDNTKITDITFCKELPQGVSAENPVNLTDDSENGKVKGYIVKNGENYKIYIVGDYIFGNSVCYNMFSGFSNLKTLDFGNFDTSNVTVMFNMFSGCSGLTFLDLSSFDTSETSNMQSMFTGCSKLESITFGTKFNTSKVTSMVSMFNGCSALESLDLSKFDTSAVTKMNSMFQNCSTLKSLDFSSFNTAKVEGMPSMFNGCSTLKSLDLSKFVTSAVEDMNGMFTGCSKLESITFGTNFNTSKVTGMNAMFSDCSALESLDLSSFDTSAVTNMDAMFKNCSTLESLDLSSFDTSKVDKMSNMFNGCSTLERLDISNFTVGNGTTVDDMFKDCSKLTLVKINSDENQKISNALGDDWTYNGETKAYKKQPANKLLKSPAPQQLKSPAPAAPATITPEKQQDGTYQFKMPAANVTVTAEFEEVPVHIHSFTYTANNGKLTATCTAGCDKGYDTTPLTLTLTAPTSLVYDGNAKAFTFADGEADAWTGAGLELPTIFYNIKQSGQSTYLPLMSGTLKDVGNYMAQITVGEKTAQVYFSIEAPHTHNPVKVTGQAATETAAGFKDYYECKDSTDACHKYFEDATAKVEITDLNAWKAQGGNGYIAPLVHSITPVSGKNATDTEAGYKPYYECKNCGKYYEDATGLIEITDIDAWKSQTGKGYIPSGNEINAAKTAAKAALDSENAKDALLDETALTNGKSAIDSAETLADIENAKNAAITAIQQAQATELANAKTNAKAALDTEEAKNPLTDKTALTNGKNSIDGATTKAAVEAAKNAAITAIQQAQATEHKDPKSPKTGDTSNMTLWVMLLALSSTGLGACLVLGKKRKNEQ